MNQESQPLVSICVSVYNVEQFFPVALASVLNQSYSNIEVILLDNGSSDGTPDIIRSITDPRVRCFQTMPNIGGYQGMNKAVGYARGEFIAVYHSDDIYEPTIVEKEAAFLVSHPEVGAVFSLDHFIDEDGRIFGKMTLPRQFLGRDSLTYQEVFPFLVRNKNILFCCPTFMIRRQVWDQVGPFAADEFDIGSDLEMWIRIVRQFPVAILNEQLMRYRVRRQNWSARYERLRTEPECNFQVLDHYIEKDGWDRRLTESDLTEYAFQRRDDEAVRAANLIISGNATGAKALLQNPFPWKTFLNGIRRRKIRTLLLRMLMRLSLALGIVRPLKRFLVWTEYGGQV